MDRLKRLFTFLENDPKDSFILFAIAKEYEKQGDFAKSEEYYLTLRNLESDYIGLYYNLGKLYEKMNAFSKAKIMYSEGLVIAKNIGDFHAASELNSAKLNLEISLDDV